MVMKPPTGGPITVAMSPGQVMVAMARINWVLGVLRSTTNRPTGTIIAPPIPWKIRARMNWIRPVDMPQKTDAIVKTTMAVPNTVRAPKRSAIQPLIGMKIASVTR